MNSYLFVTKPEFEPEQCEDGSITWSCSKTAKDGDRAFVYVVGIGIRYQWKIRSDAAYRQRNRWPYGCEVEWVHTFDPPITIRELREAFPKKVWPALDQNFRGYKSIEIGSELVEGIFRIRQTTVDPINGGSNSDTDEYGANGAWQADPEVRQQVEQVAIRLAVEHFRREGFNVTSVERDNVGWDLEARKKDHLLKIEVKGLSGKTLSVELTPNEYRAMAENRSNHRLFVVTSALEKPRSFVFKWSTESDAWVDSDGQKLGVSESVAARCFIR